MTSKITDAISQLNHNISCLEEAIPAMHEAAQEKGKQVESLRETYLSTHPEIFSGLWSFDVSLNCNSARLTGWQYDYDDKVGDDNGNQLVSALALVDTEYATTIEFQYSGEKSLLATDTDPHIQLSTVMGDISIDFYNFELSEVFQFIKEHNITIEISKIDKSISGFKERMDNMTNTKQAIIDAGLIEKEAEPDGTFVDCHAYCSNQREVLIHAPMHDDMLPIEESDDLQFNAEEVSILHKRVGVNYEYLTNLMTAMRDGDVHDMDAIYHGMETLQIEMDMIAVMIGDLDTKDEPLDVGMAGSSCWNILQGAMYYLGDTITYVTQQDNIPSLAEVHFRLNKLGEILGNCNKEFETTYLDAK